MENDFTDFTFLRENTFGSMVNYLELLNIYIRTTPGMLSELEERVGAQAWPEARRVAHKLKSNLNTVGAHSASAILHDVETRLQAGGDAGLAASVSELKTILQHVEKEVKEEIKQKA